MPARRKRDRSFCHLVSLRASWATPSAPPVPAISHPKQTILCAPSHPARMSAAGVVYAAMAQMSGHQACRDSTVRPAPARVRYSSRVKSLAFRSRIPFCVSFISGQSRQAHQSQEKAIAARFTAIVISPRSLEPSKSCSDGPQERRMHFMD